MSSPATTEDIWHIVKQELFAVLGMVTPQNQSRTVGIVYAVRDRKLYIGTGSDSWKARHIRRNPHISMTIPIAKRIPGLPWIRIPQATITFSGSGRVIPAVDAEKDLLAAVFQGLAIDDQFKKSSCLIEVIPQGDFLTYGIGVPLLTMRKPEQARGRAPVC